jgi:hypothetical protein
LTGGTSAHNVAWNHTGSGGGATVSLKVNDITEALDSNAFGPGSLTPDNVAIGGAVDNSPGQGHSGYIYDIAVFGLSLAANDQTAWNTKLLTGT